MATIIALNETYEYVPTTDTTNPVTEEFTVPEGASYLEVALDTGVEVALRGKRAGNVNQPPITFGELTYNTTDDVWDLAGTELDEGLYTNLPAYNSSSGGVQFTGVARFTCGLSAAEIVDIITFDPNNPTTTKLYITFM